MHRPGNAGSVLPGPQIPSLPTPSADICLYHGLDLDCGPGHHSALLQVKKIGTWLHHP